MRESMATAFLRSIKREHEQKRESVVYRVFCFLFGNGKKSDPKEKTRKVKTQSIEVKRLIARKIRSRVLRPRPSGTPHLR